MISNADPAEREEMAGSLRLFVHIGLPKTGSTSIQMRMFENATKLRARGYLYPLGRFGRPAYQHSEILQLVTPGTLHELAAVLRSIREEAVASNCHTVVLSGEALSSLAGKRLEWFRDAVVSEDFSPTIVVFFRPLLDYARSVAAEHMRSRASIVTPARLAYTLTKFDEDAIVGRFAAAFGSDRVIRHDLASDEDCVALFDRDIGLTAAQGAPRLNPRLDFGTLSWLNAVQSELGLSTGIVYRLYWKAFSGQPPRFAAELAFMTEVANALGGEKGDLLKAQLRQAEPAPDDLTSLEARLQYVEDFGRFVSGLRWYLRRKAFRRAFRRRFLRMLGRAEKPGGLP